MSEIITALTTAVQGAFWLAFIAAFIWGVLSILLSPCHLASIPLIVGFIDNQQVRATRQAFLLALFFAGGILTTIVSIGLITASLGWMMGDLGKWPTYVVAAILIMFGLHLADVIPITFESPVQAYVRRKSLGAAFLLGLIFGVAIGPCTFAYMAPMIAITFKTATRNWLYGAWLLAIYGIGHCGVIVLAGTSTKWVQHYLGWSETSRGPVWVKRTCGVLVVLAGFYLVWGA